MVAIVNEGEEVATRDAVERLQVVDPDRANVEIEVVKLGQLSDEELWQVEGIEEVGDASRLLVYYPMRHGKSKLCWSGDLTVETVDGWLESPLRRTIVSDLVSGVSAVWIQLDGDDEDASQRFADDVRQSLEQAKEEIEIPEGVIPRADAASYLSEHPEASMDDVLRCDVPLRVDFRIRRLDRNDPDEWATVAMIDGMIGDSDQPILIPTFGRGRMLDTIEAEDANPDALLAACRYMVSECSCTVKALNPGTDMLLAANWKNSLGTDVVMVNLQTDEQLEPELIQIPGGSDGALVEVEDERKFQIGWYTIGLIAVFGSVIAWKLVSARG